MNDAGSYGSDSPGRTVARVLLGGFLAFAGVSHLTVAREAFRAQVPEWVPLPTDTVVVASGIVEIALGVALLATPRRHRRLVGIVVALFFLAIFPGNISQFTTQTDSFGLNTDVARGVRLVFQPLLVLWALYGCSVLRDRRRRR